MGLCLACIEFFKHFEILHESSLFQLLLRHGALVLCKQTWLEPSATPPHPSCNSGSSYSPWPHSLAPFFPTRPAWYLPASEFPALVSRRGHAAGLGGTRRLDPSLLFHPCSCPLLHSPPPSPATSQHTGHTRLSAHQTSQGLT